MKYKRAILVMAVAILFGCAAVVFASRCLLKQPGNNSGRILVAATDISLGQRLTPEMFKPADWPADSGCPSGTDVDETTSSGGGCGIGVELALVLPLIAALRRRSPRSV